MTCRFASSLLLLLSSACGDPTSAELGPVHNGGDTDTDEQEPGEPVLEVYPSPLDFGSVEVGPETQFTAMLSLSNTGTADLELLSLTGGVGSGEMAFPDVAGEAVPPDSTFYAEISWEPSAPGNTEAIVEIASSDPVAGLVQILATGEALAGTLTITPEDRDLGEVPVGEEISEVVSFYNEGNAELVIEGLDVDLGDGWNSPDLLQLQDALPVTIEAGGVLSLPVTFEARSGATSILQVVVDSSDPWMPSQEASFLATGS